MPDVSLSILAIVFPAALFAGISKGGFGSGAAFASASILAVMLDPGTALAIMLPLLMLIDAATLGPYWKAWSWNDARVLCLGAVPGILLGAYLYGVADPDLFRILIGTISITYVAWQVMQKIGEQHGNRRPLPKWAGGMAGLVAGFTSFVSHAGGPPAAVYLLSRGLNKTEYQATTVLVFWFVNIVKAVPYATLGLFTLETAQVSLYAAPFALAGAWAGVHLHRRVSERVFFGLTYVFLTATGVKLIWDGVF